MIARLRRSDIALHGAIVFSGVAAANVLNYLYYVLVGRIGGIEVYGAVTSLVSTILVLSAPALVVQLVVARLASDLDAQGNVAALRQLADRAVAVTGAVAGAFAVVAIVARAPLRSFFHLGDDTSIVLAALTFACITVVYAQRGVLQGAHRFGDLSTSYAIEAAAKVAIGVPLVVPFGAAGALFGALVCELAAAIFAAIVIRRRFGSRTEPLALDGALVRRVASGVGLGQLTFTVLMFYDVPIIKHAFDAHVAGLYAAAALVGRAVLAAISFVPTLVMPKATARAAEGRPSLPLLGAALGIAGAIVAIAVAFGALAPRFTVTVIAGRPFAPAAGLVLPYVTASGALALANVIAAYHMGLHRYAFVVPVAVVALAEIVVFTSWHPDVASAVGVLLVGHALVLVVTVAALPLRIRG